MRASIKIKARELSNLRQNSSFMDLCGGFRTAIVTGQMKCSKYGEAIVLVSRKGSGYCVFFFMQKDSIS